MNFIHLVSEIYFYFYLSYILIYVYILVYVGLDLFERQKKYNVPIHVARHPELVEYVKDMIRACRPDLEKVCVYMDYHTYVFVPICKEA